MKIETYLEVESGTTEAIDKVENEFICSTLNCRERTENLRLKLQVITEVQDPADHFHLPIH